MPGKPPRGGNQPTKSSKSMTERLGSMVGSGLAALFVLAIISFLVTLLLAVAFGPGLLFGYMIWGQ